MVPSSVTLLLIGASGDLAKRKIIPAIYQLLASDAAPNIILIGAAYEMITANQMLESARPFISDIRDDVWEKLHAISSYYQLDAYNAAAYDSLRAWVQEQEGAHALSGSRIIYCAVPSSLFEVITQYASDSGLIHRKDVQDPIMHRIVYEKPFGHDAASALALYVSLSRYLNAHQIYCVDHFLAKHMMYLMPYMRRDVPDFEQTLQAHAISHIEIVLHESAGVGDRTQYYDSFGAIADVVQNHMIEMMAMLAMDLPHYASDAQRLQQARADIIAHTQFVSGIRGRYASYPGTSSDVETYAALIFEIDTKQWKGVSWHLSTGKMLQRKQTFIRITYRNGSTITFDIYPNNGISGTGEYSHISQQLQAYYAAHESHQISSYGRILRSVMQGNFELHVGLDEIVSAWRIIETITQAHVPMYRYEDHSSGPLELKKII